MGSFANRVFSAKFRLFVDSRFLCAFSLSVLFVQANMTRSTAYIICVSAKQLTKIRVTL